MKRTGLLTAVIFLAAIAFGPIIMAKGTLANISVPPTQGSKLEKNTGMLDKVDGAKRDTFATDSLLSFAFDHSYANATCYKGKEGIMTFDMYGIPVKNSDGEFLGTFRDIMVSNKNYNDAFALINLGSSGEVGDSGALEPVSMDSLLTPVPMAALKISETNSGKLNIVLNMTEAKLEAGPSLHPTKIEKSQYDLQLYRYYGIQPYWSEKCMVHGK